MWNWSLPQFFTRYLLQQIRAASRASLESCSNHLPGHNMVQTKYPQGVETRLLEETVMKLNTGSRGEVEVCQDLLNDLKKHRNI